jgi:hypothetical protein
MTGMKKKQPDKSRDTRVAAGEISLPTPDDVFAYWNDQAMADAVPLPIEVDAEPGSAKRKGKQRHARRSKK